jgi:hypothetical protein
VREREREKREERNLQSQNDKLTSSISWDVYGK